MDTTAKLSTFVVFILVGARVFSLTFYGVNGHVWVEHLLLHLPGGQLGFLIVVNILIFFLAFFLDFFELSFIVIPLVGPVADKLGIDLIWFGVLLGVNMQTSFMHPPFGFALFYLRSVAPAKDFLDKITGRLTERVTTGQIYWGAVPFVLIQIVMIALVIASRRWSWSTRRRSGHSTSNKIQIIVPEDQSAPGDQPTKPTPSPTRTPSRTRRPRRWRRSSAAAPRRPTPKTRPPPQDSLRRRVRTPSRTTRPRRCKRRCGGTKAPDEKK